MFEWLEARAARKAVEATRAMSPSAAEALVAAAAGFTDASAALTRATDRFASIDQESEDAAEHALSAAAVKNVNSSLAAGREEIGIAERKLAEATDRLGQAKAAIDRLGGAAPASGAAKAASEVDEAGLGGLSKALAAGFTSVAAVLAWFGVSKGVLDRMIVQYGRPTIWIFCLVGLGVLLSLVAVAWRPARKVSWWWLGSVLLSLVAFTYLAFPDIIVRSAATARGQISGWKLVIGLAFAVAAVVMAILGTRSQPASAKGAPAPIALMLVAAMCMSVGVYGAVKLSVISKRYSQPLEVVSTVAADATDTTWSIVTTTVSGGGFQVNAIVEVALLDGERAVPTDPAAGVPTESVEVAVGYVATPVGGEMAARTLAFRIPSALDDVIVASRVCVQTTGREGVPADSSGPGSVQTRRVLCPDERRVIGWLDIGGEPAADTTAPVLAASATATEPGVAVAHVTATGLDPDGMVTVKVTVNGVEFAAATVRPDAAGALEWTTAVSPPPTSKVSVVAGYDLDRSVVASSWLQMPALATS